jgi:mitochondrial fission protein ELM1
MWPGPPAGAIDLIATPAHDRVPAGYPLLRTLGAPNRVTPARLAEAARAWQDRLEAVPRPRLAVLVGGSTARFRFGVDDARALGSAVATLARSRGAGTMVTTSRRTNDEARMALFAALGPAASFDWRHQGGDNPYFGFLALADFIVVTGDSTAMCTEACTAGRPVYVFAPLDRTADKHKRLHAALYRRGSARPLESALGQGGLASWTYPPLDDAGAVAAEIRRLTGLGAG